MTPWKPEERRKMEKELRKIGWELEKGATDWKVRDDKGKIVVPNVVVPHPPGTQIAPASAKKIRQMMKEKEGR